MRNERVEERKQKGGRCKYGSSMMMCDRWRVRGEVLGVRSCRKGMCKEEHCVKL